MAIYKGDYPTSHTAVTLPFDSFAAATGAPSAVTNFANTDVQIYKDGGTTQRSSASGITVTTSFDTQTGEQMVVIDLSDNTDAGFYAAGHEYDVFIQDITVDGQTLRFYLGAFSIERAGGVLALLKAGTAKVTLADGVAHGGTLGSSTATLALSRLSVVSQSSNTTAFTVTGNGTGNGATISSGSGASGVGVSVLAASTNDDGFKIAGAGSGNGFKISAGATGQGLRVNGGATSGDGILVFTTSGHGFNLTPQGSSKHGIFATGGDAGTSDGIKAAAGTGGVDIRGNQTGNLVGTVSTLTTYTGNTPQTGDAYARLGAPAGASVSADIAAIRTDTNTTIPNLIAALNNISNANVKTQVVAALATDTYAEPAQGTPPATTTLAVKTGWLYKAFRNRTTMTSSQYSLYNDDAITVDAKASFSDDSTTADRGEISSGP